MTRILIVEDEVAVRAWLAQVLRNAGFEVLEARDGTEALRLHQAHPFELVITDIVMPDKEGLELIRELRQARPETKIIATSGSEHPGTEVYLKIAKMLGAAEVLVKPFSEQELLAAVHQVLGV